MVWTCFTWNGTTESFFINWCGVKGKVLIYKQYLQKELLSVVQPLYIQKNGFFLTPVRHCTSFFTRQSVHVLSNLMNSTPRHLIAIPSIIIFGIKWKRKYMKPGLTSRLKARDIWRSGLKVYERNCPQSSRDSKSNQTVCWKIKNNQRTRELKYQNDLWLKFIKHLTFFVQFQVFDRTTLSAHHKMVSHCMVKEFLVLILVIIDFFNNFLKKQESLLLWAFFFSFFGSLVISEWSVYESYL